MTCRKDDFINKAKIVHNGENLDYSKVKYINMHTKVTIIDHDLDKDGIEYGEYEQEPAVHLKGCGHPRKGSDKHAVSEKYVSGYGLDAICKEFHIGKLKAKSIIISDGVDIRPKSSFKKYSGEDKTPVFQEVEGYVRKAVSKDGKFSSYDYLNKSGVLSEYVTKTLGIKIPSSYVRRRLAKETGKFWYEDYFDIVLEKKNVVETKKCPYCDWETIDVGNRSGAFEQHLKNKHNILMCDYISKNRADAPYFNKNKIDRELNSNNYVVCKLCGKKLSRIDSKHLKKHNISKFQYISKFGDAKTVSDSLHKKLSTIAEKSNTNMQHNFTSKPEQEIIDYILSLGVKCGKNRSLLGGKEIDILVEDKRVAFEFDGNKYHTEFFGGKHKNYHLDKTLECKRHGVNLIHIFEDEYAYNKTLVLEKIKHILGKDDNACRVAGRKCVVKEITKHDSYPFLEKYHIQGPVASTIYIGAFYNNKLVAVMTFKKEQTHSDKWELNRFASDYNYVMQGVGGKIFSYFVSTYNPSSVKSFLDRRWCFNEKSNLYTKLGFSFEKYTLPEYRYFNSSVDRYKRFHKFNFRKQILHKKFGLPIEMTELEMARKLGYDRIWDCGLIKYVWKNKKAQEQS